MTKIVRRHNRASFVTVAMAGAREISRKIAIARDKIGRVLLGSARFAPTTTKLNSSIAAYPACRFAPVMVLIQLLSRFRKIVPLSAVRGKTAGVLMLAATKQFWRFAQAVVPAVLVICSAAFADQ